LKHHFEYVDGKIYLVITVKIWGGDIVNRHDVTDEVMPLVDKYLDDKLGLSNYLPKPKN